MVLDYAALAVIFLILILITVAIVFIGSTPGKIARRRGHPWLDAVNAASWIGLATGVLWPFAFVWAFLPLPARNDGSSDTSPSDSERTRSTAQLEGRIAALEATIEKLRTPEQEGPA